MQAASSIKLNAIYKKRIEPSLYEQDGSNSPPGLFLVRGAGSCLVEPAAAYSLFPENPRAEAEVK
jgi:hypothetical protein